MTKGRDNIDRPTRPHFKEAGEHPERAGRGNEDDKMLFIKFPKKKYLKTIFQVTLQSLISKTSMALAQKDSRINEIEQRAQIQAKQLGTKRVWVS